MNNLESKVAIEGTSAILELIAQTSKYVNLLEKQLTELQHEHLVKNVVMNSLDAETLLDTLQNQEPQPTEEYLKKCEITLSNRPNEKAEISNEEIDAFTRRIDECIESIINELGKLIAALNDFNNLFRSLKEKLQL